jgi:outer membrane protein assembly factor BamB/tRNA A-37 threonylcarbamoyl transferase component Bud32
MEPLSANDPQAVGEYRLQARLGAGGMGRVFLGYSLAGRAVAIKVVHPELARDQAFRRRFRHEVAAAQAVSGAFTAPVVATGLDDDPPWLATVFVPGPSLDDAVARVGPLPEAAVWKLAAGLVEALRAIHAANLVHRDLKPQNVLLAVDGPRVIDFGISRALDATVMTATGMVIGTPSFMSPEQAQGAPAGPESDVFSLGCLLAFAATGAGPFGEGTPATLLYRIVHAPPALDGVPGRMRDLLAGCLAKHPAQRPPLSLLAYAISAQAPPDAGAQPMSFWPAAVAGLVGAYQLDPHDSASTAPLGLRTWDTNGHRPGLALSGATTVAPPGPPAGHGSLAGFSGSRRRGTGGGGRHAAPPTAPSTAGLARPSAAGPASTSPWQPAGPPRGAGDGMLLARAAEWGQRPVLEGRLGPAVTRRRALGLAAVAAAGLAVMGWELSSSGPATPAAARRPSGTSHGGTSGSKSTSSARTTLKPGAQLWSFATGGQVTADLATAGGVIYAGSTDQSVYALSPRGTKIWSVATSGAVQSGPAVAGGVVYVGSDDHNVYALRVSNGAEQWNFSTGGPVRSGPAVADGFVYVGSDDFNLYALEVKSGQGLWRFKANAAVTARPVVEGGLILLASLDDRIYALHQAGGHEVWGGATGGPVTQGPVVVNGIAYVGSSDHHVYAIQASKGPEIWSHLTAGPVNCAPAVAGGVVYVGSDDYNVYALQASNGALIWKHPTGNVVRSAPVVAGGVVYVGSSDHNLYALNASNGSVIWQFPTGGPVTASPVLASGVVYAGSQDGKIYALQA